MDVIANMHFHNCWSVAILYTSPHDYFKSRCDSRSGFFLKSFLVGGWGMSVRLVVQYM